MSKKGVIKNTNLPEEDLEIKKVASEKNKFLKYLAILFIIIFVGVLICSFILVHNFYQTRDSIVPEIINIENDKNKILIVNNGIIKEKFTNENFNNEQNITIERLNTLEMVTDKNATENEKIQYNIRYIINKNDFEKTGINNTDSEILVRFSYSYDGDEWTYINNVISTETGTILPLMGKNYDVSGLVTTLKIATNEVLENAPGESTTVYWRSETIIKNIESKNIEKNLDADFKIEYGNNN